MLDLESRDEKVSNIKTKHDSYMRYARGLLVDTRGRLSRMNKLSQEVNFLANKIQPSYRPSSRCELVATNNVADLDIRKTEKNKNLLMRKRSCPEFCIPSPVEEETVSSMETLYSRLHTGVNLGGDEATQRTRSASEPFLLGKKHNEGKTIQRQKDDFTQSRYMPMYLKPKTPSSTATKAKIDEVKNNGIGKLKPKTRLKLRVILPDCAKDDEEAREGEGSENDNAGDTSESHPRLGNRESLVIPRVTIQGLSSENHATEIRLPKIMDKFHRPLQLTAKYRLPAFHKRPNPRPR